MYASRTTQLIVGIFALVGIAALAILSMSLGRIELFAGPTYTLFANFDNISGLKAGDQVQLAGVDIGKVTAIGLHDNRAHVAMRIKQGIAIDDDAIASIKTSGIIGDKYIAIALGPSDQTMANGETIRHTQSAFVLEDAIGQLINGTGSGSSPAGNNTKTAAGSGSGVSIDPTANAANCDCSQQKGSK
ncbi:MAG TPA: outer membrane lipid asymmetry maintenance protein MlaD [Candidatus Binataceae bacterium]|nr:outer membrane lipid asymmetry maintenance protein MlaD [Candidatus Binataceae bacterium]